MLERPSAWPHFQHLRDWAALKRALEDFNREQGGPKQRMPVLADLVSAGRDDLVQAIKAAGVIPTVATCYVLEQGCGRPALVLIEEGLPIENV